MGQAFSCVSAGPVLFSAAIQGDSNTVDAILRQSVLAATFTDNEKATALHHAARLGHMGVVSSIWGATSAYYGVDRARKLVLDVKDNKGFNALMHASKHGQGEVVEYLLMEGGNPFTRDTSRNTALHIIVKEGHIDTASRLLGTKSHRLMKGHDGILASFSTENGQRNSRYIDLHNADGQTALHIAVVQGNLQMFRLLARRGADLSARIRQPLPNSPGRTCTEGSTILHIAAAFNHEHIIRYILHIQNRIPNLDLRHLQNRAGLKPINCIVARGATSTTEIQFMLDDSLPESILQILYVPERTVVVAGAGGDSGYVSSAFRKNLLSIMGSLLQRIKLMLACDRIAYEVAQPQLSKTGSVRKDQILEFVRQVSQKKVALEEGSDMGSDENYNSQKYNSGSTNTTSSTITSLRNQRSMRQVRHSKMRSADFHYTNPDDPYTVHRSQGSETNMKTGQKSKLSHQEFDQVMQEIDKTLTLIEEVKEIMLFKRKMGKKRSRRRHIAVDARLEGESDDLEEDDAAWKGAIAGVVKPSMLAELYQAARFLVTNVSTAPLILKDTDPHVALQKIRSTSCILRWSLNSVRQNQLQEWEKQIKLGKGLQTADGQLRSSLDKTIRGLSLPNPARNRSFREVILQHSAREMNPETVAKLMEATNKRHNIDSAPPPQTQINIIQSKLSSQQQQPPSSSSRVLQPLISSHNELRLDTPRLSIIREESQEALTSSISQQHMASQNSEQTVDADAESQYAEHVTHVDGTSHAAHVDGTSYVAHVDGASSVQNFEGDHQTQDDTSLQIQQQIQELTQNEGVAPPQTNSDQFSDQSHQNVENVQPIPPQEFAQSQQRYGESHIEVSRDMLNMQLLELQHNLQAMQQLNLAQYTSEPVDIHDSDQQQHDGHILHAGRSEILRQQSPYGLGGEGEVGMNQISVASDTLAMQLLAQESQNLIYGSAPGLGLQMEDSEFFEAEEHGAWSTGGTIPADENKDDGDEGESGKMQRGKSQALSNLSSRPSSKVLSVSSDGECCSICYERVPSLSIDPCHHEMCVECAFHMSHDGVGYPRCPFCRRRIRNFHKIPKLFA